MSATTVSKRRPEVLPDPIPLTELRNMVTITVPQAAAQLGICRPTAYKAVHEGDIPSIKVCGKYLVPVKPFLALLGHDSDGV